LTNFLPKYITISHLQETNKQDAKPDGPHVADILMKPEEILTDYIEKVLNVQDDFLSEQHLRDLAFELGMDEAAYEELQQVYLAHLERGHAFLKHENFWEATEEFRQALSINPLKPEGLMALSEAFESWWKDTGNKEYKKEALYFARRVLKFDPDHAKAIASVSRMQGQSKGKRVRVNALIGLSLAVMLAFALQRVFENPEPETEYKFPELPLSEDQGIAQGGLQIFPDFEVPIHFKIPSDVNFELLPKMSLIHDRKDNYTYELQGQVRVIKGELGKLNLDLRMVLEDSSVWLTQQLRVDGLGSLAARRGDIIPFGKMAFEKREAPDNLAFVELEVSEVLVKRAEESYPEAQALDFEWKEPPAEGVALDLSLRYYELETKGSFPHFTIAIEAENTGNLSIEVLELEVDLLDKQGELLFRDHQYTHSAGEPALEPGSMYVSSRLYGLSKVEWKKIHTYAVRVLEARPTK